MGQTTAAVDTVLDFHVMAPVAGTFVGTANPVRGVPGGGLPWVIAHGDGTLRSDGSLTVNVKGLVLATDPSVPTNQQGTNPAPQFVGIVSCQAPDAAGGSKGTNVMTPPVQATATGDARIEATVQLPTPCVAPIVFVADAAGAWFAASGR
jgi:hypothetical protein